jgi:hypothetical protein
VVVPAVVVVSPADAVVVVIPAAAVVVVAVPAPTVVVVAAPAQAARSKTKAAHMINQIFIQILLHLHDNQSHIEARVANNQLDRWYEVSDCPRPVRRAERPNS